MLGLEDNLTAEIEFWRELIDARATDAPRDTLERMQQALALAEHKLSLAMRASGNDLLTGHRLRNPGSAKEH